MTMKIEIKAKFNYKGDEYKKELFTDPYKLDRESKDFISALKATLKKLAIQNDDEELLFMIEPFLMGMKTEYNDTYNRFINNHKTLFNE